MTETRQVLFIQGGGAGVHDEWDDKLVDSLRRELGDGYEVRYPRMPAEDDPGDAAKVTGPVELALSTAAAAELILIDVPLEFEPVGVWAGEW